MSSCSDCTRRALLQGLGAAGLVVLAGCGKDPDVSEGPADAFVPPPDETPVPCGPGQVCIDVTRSSSGTLSQVGGTHKISIPGDALIIVRTAETTFVTLSAVCTHERCSVRYTTGTQVRCPCHGSMFNFDGSVARGPAQDPLKVYATSFDASTNILTITV